MSIYAFISQNPCIERRPRLNTGNCRKGNPCVTENLFVLWIRAKNDSPRCFICPSRLLPHQYRLSGGTHKCFPPLPDGTEAGIKNSPAKARWHKKTLPLKQELGHIAPSKCPDSYKGCLRHFSLLCSPSFCFLGAQQFWPGNFSWTAAWKPDAFFIRAKPSGRYSHHSSSLKNFHHFGLSASPAQPMAPG